MIPRIKKAIFFDLDGTLVDTAQDMAWALNQLLDEQARPPLAYAAIRSEASRGSRALVNLAFDECADSERFEQLRQRFLTIYQANLHRETRLFPAMDHVLNYLEAAQIFWGIVTNKPSRLALPLLQSMQLKERAAVVVCADQVGAAKPDAKPLQVACRRIGVEADQCLYIGDDERDVQAAHRAGMACIILCCGYIRRHEDPKQWGADRLMDTHGDLLKWIAQQLNQTAR